MLLPLEDGPSIWNEQHTHTLMDQQDTHPILSTYCNYTQILAHSQQQLKDIFNRETCHTLTQSNSRWRRLEGRSEECLIPVELHTFTWMLPSGRPSHGFLCDFTCALQVFNTRDAAFIFPHSPPDFNSVGPLQGNNWALVPHQVNFICIFCHLDYDSDPCFSGQMIALMYMGVLSHQMSSDCKCVFLQMDDPLMCPCHVCVCLHMLNKFISS